jgi:hypothetical protein
MLAILFGRNFGVHFSVSKPLLRFRRRLGYEFLNVCIGSILLKNSEILSRQSC